MAKKKKAAKFSFINAIHEGVLAAADVTKNGTIRIKRTDVKKVLEDVFDQGVKLAASGERVRFPVIGALVRKDVPAKKGGVKTTNPFTGEPMVTKARAATKKPRWSFPKNLKTTFGNKRFW